MPRTRSHGVLADVTDAIGDTPLVELGRIAAGRPGRLLAKLEYLNPGHSKKDRAALEIILAAERSGELRSGQTVVELTSGNMGTGLAIVCGVRGYRFVAVMSRGNSPERARMMAALGAEVILVDQAPGSPPGQVSGEDLELVEEVAQAIVADRGAFRADQFVREGSVTAHEEGTGAELWRQSGGEIDVFVDFVGSAGSFTGCARALRKRAADIRCYVVEPVSAARLAGLVVTGSSHRIQGGGYNRDLGLLDRSLVTGYVQVSDSAAADAARMLARVEGIFGGFSAGANLAASLQLMATREAGSTIAFLVNDSGLKYLSTDLWAD